MALTLGDIRQQASDLAAADFELAYIAHVANRGLLELGPFLRIIDKVEIDWPAGEEAMPAPDNAIEFRRTATWRPLNTNSFRRLRRVAVDSDKPGWWYDGLMIGLNPAPGADGVFQVHYYRYPRLLSTADVSDAPEGGDIVAAALIQYVVADYYAQQGDLESRELAAPFRAAFEQLKQQIAATRARLINLAPDSWAAGDR